MSDREDNDENEEIPPKVRKKSRQGLMTNFFQRKGELIVASKSIFFKWNLKFFVIIDDDSGETLIESLQSTQSLSKSVNSDSSNALDLTAHSSGVSNSSTNPTTNVTTAPVQENLATCSTVEGLYISLDFMKITI